LLREKLDHAIQKRKRLSTEREAWQDRADNLETGAAKEVNKRNAAVKSLSREIQTISLAIKKEASSGESTSPSSSSAEAKPTAKKYAWMIGAIGVVALIALVIAVASSSGSPDKVAPPVDSIFHAAPSRSSSADDAGEPSESEGAARLGALELLVTGLAGDLAATQKKLTVAESKISDLEAWREFADTTRISTTRTTATETSTTATESSTTETSTTATATSATSATRTSSTQTLTTTTTTTATTATTATTTTKAVRALTLVLWGAAGGGNNGNTMCGGPGGFAAGTLQFEVGTKLRIIPGLGGWLGQSPCVRDSRVRSPAGNGGNGGCGSYIGGGGGGGSLVLL
jgi:hypothetical protein